MNEAKVKGLKAMLRSVVMSKSSGVEARLLQREYAEIVGQPIQFRDFGYDTLEGLLRSLTDTVELHGYGPELVIFPVSTGDTDRLQSLISRQKKNKKKSSKKAVYNPPARRYQSRGSGGRPMPPPSYRSSKGYSSSGSFRPSSSYSSSSAYTKPSSYVPSVQQNSSSQPAIKPYKPTYNHKFSADELRQASNRRPQKSKDEREQYLKSVDDENKEEVARQRQCEEIEREKRHLELRQQELQKEKALHRSKINPKPVRVGKHSTSSDDAANSERDFYSKRSFSYSDDNNGSSIAVTFQRTPERPQEIEFETADSSQWDVKEPLFEDEEEYIEEEGPFCQTYEYDAETYDKELIPPHEVLEIGSRHVALFTHVESPHQFFIHMTSNTALSELMTNLAAAYEKTSSIDISSISVGMYCAAISVCDNQWYRAKVVERPVKNAKGVMCVKIYYVDFGNLESVPCKDIRLLDQDELFVPSFMLVCALYGIYETTMTGFEKASKYLRSLTIDDNGFSIPNYIKVDDIVDGVHYVTLYNDQSSTTSVNDKLVEMRYVTNITKLEHPPDITYPTEDQWMVMVSCAVTVSKLTVVLVGEEYSDKRAELEAKLIDEPYINGYKPGIADVCAAQVNQDDGTEYWYRALVTAIDGKEVTFYYLDHGDTGTVNLDNIKPFRQDLNLLPYQAIDVHLAKLTFETHAKIEAYLMENVLGRTLIAKVNSRSPQLMVVLWDTSTGKNVDVNGKLIDLLSFDDLRVQLPATMECSKAYLTNVSETGKATIQLQQNSLLMLLQFESFVQTTLQLGDRGSYKVVGPLHVGHLYVAEYQDEWYRAKLDRFVGDDKAFITYLDYGNTDIVRKEELLSLDNLCPEMYKLPTQCLEVELAGLPPNGLYWSSRAAKYLKEFISDEREIQVEVVNNKLSRVDIHLIEDDNTIIDIGSEMRAKKDLFDDVPVEQLSAQLEASVICLGEKEDSVIVVEDSYIEPEDTIAQSTSTIPASRYTPPAAQYTPSDYNVIPSQNNNSAQPPVKEITPQVPTNKVNPSPFLRSETEFEDDWSESFPSANDSVDVEDVCDIDHRHRPAGHPTVENGDKVVVTDATHPHNFMLQLLKCQDDINTLSQDLDDFYDYDCNYDKPTNVQIGEIYAGLNNTRHWYRVEVKAVQDRSRIKVFFVDHGDCGIVHISSLMPLPKKFRQMPFQSLTASLKGVASTTQNFWSPPAVNSFRNLVMNKELTVQDCEVKTQNPYCLSLTLKNEHTHEQVHKTLIAKNWAAPSSSVGNTTFQVNNPYATSSVTQSTMNVANHGGAYLQPAHFASRHVYQTTQTTYNQQTYKY